MRAIDRKVFRDLTRMKAQAAAIALVIAAGVSLFVATVSAYHSMRVSEREFYARQRFPHVWSAVARAPLSVLRKLAMVPGVTAVEGRITQRAVLDVPGLDEPASALLISTPATAGHALSDLYVRRGRYVERGRADEALVSEAFAEANQLKPGDRISAVVAGHRVGLRIVGVSLSPEHVMPLPPGGLAIDDRRFGILWMEREQLEALVDLRGAVNEVAGTLAYGVDERNVLAAFDQILAPYNTWGAYGRTNHPSHVMLEEHIEQFRAMALVIPTIFLLVAAFLVNVVLSRLIATQREQIGVLKAFGYSSGRVALHYLELTLLIVSAGVLLGVPVGAWLGQVMAQFYASFFRFPVLIFRLEPGVVALAALINAGAAIVGAFGSLRRVMTMPPAVAMSAEIPAYGHTLFDRAWLSRLIGPVASMVLRNLIRRPLRSLLGVAGMASAVGVLVLGESLSDAMKLMTDVRYQHANRADTSVALAQPRALTSARDFTALPGVRQAEPFRALAVRLRTRHGAQNLSLVGLPNNGVLRRIAGYEGPPVAAPASGVIVTRWLAERFDLERGSLLTLEILENQRRSITVRLVGTVDEPLGLAAYMELKTLGRLLGEPETHRGASLAVDPVHQRELNAVLKRMPAAISVESRRGALEVFESMSRRMLTFIREIELLFAIIIAFGVVFNTARIALAERGRELATLRVLGFTRGEVSRILLGEVAVLAVPAIPLGFVLGYGLTGALVRAINGPSMHFAVVVSRTTYAFAALMFIMAAAVSAWVVQRSLNQLDLVAALKAKE